MVVNRSQEYLTSLVHELTKLGMETEWVEFKVNNDNPQEIGEYLSALSNTAALLEKSHAYVIWGIDNQTGDLCGSTFSPTRTRVGGEELESWLMRLLSPRINCRFHELQIDGKAVVILEIGAAFSHPVQFQGTEYIRIGTYKKKLKEFPEKERALWRVFDRIPFESEIAAENVSIEDILRLLNYPAYFDLLGLLLPESRSAIIGALAADKMIIPVAGEKWNITNLGAILLAKTLTAFNALKRKTIRVVLYRGENRIDTVREYEHAKGYASGFDELVKLVIDLLPSKSLAEKGIDVRLAPRFLSVVVDVTILPLLFLGILRPASTFSNFADKPIHTTIQNIVNISQLSRPFLGCI